jgi:hypothetical protein
MPFNKLKEFWEEPFSISGNVIIGSGYASVQESIGETDDTARRSRVELLCGRSRVYALDTFYHIMFLYFTME